MFAHRMAKAVPQGTADVRQQLGPSTKQLNAEPIRQFKCDGRTHCSQMTSCEEAMFFLKNCPGVKMDGDNDGIPCEEQWCKS